MMMKYWIMSEVYFLSALIIELVPNIQFNTKTLTAPEARPG